MVNISKRRAGSDSHGNEWERDGAVVDVAPEVAAELLAIPDGGFDLAPDEEEPPPPVVSVDTNRPGGTPVHHPAGSEPDAGDITQVPEASEPDAETKPKATTRSGRKAAGSE